MEVSINKSSRFENSECSLRGGTELGEEVKQELTK